MHKALGDKPGLVLLDGPVWASLNMEYPFAANDLAAFGLRDNIVHVEVLSSLHLIFTSCEPFGGIRTGHSFIISLWFRCLGIGKICVVVG